MNITRQAQSAYAPTQMPVQTPRSVEAKLFSQVTSRLKKAQANPSSFAELVAALHDNRKIWTTFASAVAESDNRLPNPLRAQIFYLAEFTEFHTQKILRKEADAAALIDINAAIMRGLNGTEG